MSKTVQITISATDSFSSVFQQYNNAIRGAATETDNLSAKQAQSKSAIDSMGTAVTGMIAAYAGMRGLQLVGDMIELGTQANIAETVFSTLVGTMGEYEDVMNRLRNVTGNIVDDKTLQEGANRFMQMGIAQDPAELARLMEMAIKLGGSMGMDPTKAISDFSLMLANNSIMRLDQFGISAGAVRQRMAELKETVEGIDRSEAFTMAVMEIGAASLDKLGDAANAASTPLNRLFTDISNKAQDFAQNFTTGANALVGIAEVLSGSSPLQQQIRRDAEANASVYLDAFKTALSGTDMAGMGAIIGDEGLSQALADAFERVSLMPGASMAEIFGNEQSRDAVTQAIVTTITQAQQAAAVQIQQQTPDFMAAALVAGRPGTDIQNIIAEGFQPTQAFLNAQQEIRNAHGMLVQFTGTYTDLASLPPLSQFMRPEDADTITRLFESAQTDLDAIERLHDQDLISDAQLQDAQDMTDRLGVMSDQAQAAADAFENLSLSQALGQTEGGIAGEITDLVEKYMKGQGAEEGDITAMLQGMGLATGRETSASLLLQNMLVPMLAGMSPGQAGGAAMNIQDFLQNAALMNYGQQDIASFLPMFANRSFSGEKGKYDAMTAFYKGGEAGGAGDMSDAVSSTEAIAGNMGEAATQAQALTDAIISIPDAKTVKITLTADDPSGILALMGGGSVGVQVRDNGGTVPGTRGGATTGGGGSKPAGGIGKNKPI